MYVIATVICPNFHFSVSPHVPFLNLLFEQIANSNEYLLAKFGFDTAENEPLKVHLIFKIWDLIFTEPPRPLLPAETWEQGKLLTSTTAPKTSIISGVSLPLHPTPNRLTCMRVIID